MSAGTNGFAAVRRGIDVPPAQTLDVLEQAVQEAQEHRLRYQELFEFAPDGYVITDAQGIVLQANQAATTILGCDKHFLIHKPLAFLLDERGRQLVYRLLARSLAGESDLPVYQARPSTSRARRRYVELSLTRQPGECGGPVSLRWLFRDVSGIRRAEEALQSQTILAEGLVEATDALLLVVDAGGKILRANACMQATSGYEASELLDQDWSNKLIAPSDQPLSRQMLGNELNIGSARRANLTLVTREGNRRSVTWSARAFKAGEVDAVALLGHDVTDLRTAERQALESERLATIGQTAAALAHECRNALQRAQSCLTLLGFRLWDRPEALELLTRLQQAQDDLSHLFEDVRGFASPMTIHTSPCNLAQVWRDAWAEVGSARDGKDADLREEPFRLDQWCTGDGFRLKQVFRNLFENALTVGSDPVRVTVRCSSAELDGRPALRIAVCNDGPSFTPEQRSRMFEPFFTTKTSGTGLGLAICRRIVEAHGGQIVPGDDSGPGAEFVITLPRS
jgi:PAS domain S-box-containing protein